MVNTLQERPVVRKNNFPPNAKQPPAEAGRDVVEDTNVPETAETQPDQECEHYPRDTRGTNEHMFEGTLDF